jgi:hypothetical protein
MEDLILIDQSEIARLRRIEAAARELLSKFDNPDGDVRMYMEIYDGGACCDIYSKEQVEALRKALEDGQE